MRRFITLGAALTLAAGGYLLGVSSTAPHGTSEPFSTPCLDEGANGCFWDAQRAGNGEGSSYVVTDSGQVFRFDPSVSSDSKHAFTNH